MSSAASDLVESLQRWAEDDRAVVAMVLFGSQARSVDNPARADVWSDVDVQIVTWQPKRFHTPEWTAIFGGCERWAFVVRRASGGLTKVTVLFKPGVEVDAVIVPARRLGLARIAVSLGLHRKVPALATSLNELATIMSGGYRVLKGGRRWEKFYARVVAEVRGARLDQAAVLALGHEFVCDYCWVRQKLKRSELVAAQRVLHRSLVEINFRLLHEARLRRGEPSFREARRVEWLLSQRDLALITASAALNPESLAAAAARCAASFRSLTTELVGDAWKWPEGLP